MRTSHINPKLSAWACINGVHNLNKILLAPPGTKIIMHSKPTQWDSWAHRGLKGFCIALVPNHYRCLTCYLLTTRNEVLCGTVKLTPHCIPIPETSMDNHVKKTVNNLIHLLLHKSPAISALQPKHSR